jgi:hypothetical protein
MSNETKFLDMLPEFGRPPKFKTAKELMDKFIEYVRTVDEMPIRVSQTVRKKGKKDVDANSESLLNLVAHPLSIREFCLFAGISNWSEFKSRERHQSGDFLIVITRIEDYTVNQQINGAMSGLYNANIVARLNGIVEKTEITGKDGKDLIPAQMTDDEIKKELERIRKSRNE